MLSILDWCFNTNTAPWKAKNKGDTDLNSFVTCYLSLISSFFLYGASKLSEKPEKKTTPDDDNVRRNSSNVENCKMNYVTH